MNWKIKATVSGFISEISFVALGTMTGAKFGPTGMIIGAIIGGIACISLLVACHSIAEEIVKKRG